MGRIPRTCSESVMTATSYLNVLGSHRGWIVISWTERRCPCVLVNTVRPTTTRRSDNGNRSGPGPKDWTQWAAVSTWNDEMREPPQNWRWKSFVPADWMSKAAWNGYFPSATAVPPTTRGPGAGGTGGRPSGPGRDRIAAAAKGVPSRLNARATSSVTTSQRARRAWGPPQARRGPIRRDMGPRRVIRGSGTVDTDDRGKRGRDSNLRAEWPDRLQIAALNTPIHAATGEGAGRFAGTGMRCRGICGCRIRSAGRRRWERCGFCWSAIVVPWRRWCGRLSKTLLNLNAPRN